MNKTNQISLIDKTGEYARKLDDIKKWRKAQEWGINQTRSEIIRTLINAEYYRIQAMPQKND